MDRISRAKNRMRQSRSSGTVGGEGGNLLAYPANLIKLHKAQLFSDRMSCHNATANQVRVSFTAFHPVSIFHDIAKLAGKSAGFLSHSVSS